MPWRNHLAERFTVRPSTLAHRDDGGTSHAGDRPKYGNRQEGRDSGERECGSGTRRIGQRRNHDDARQNREACEEGAHDLRIRGGVDSL